MGDDTEGNHPDETLQGRYTNYCRIGQNAMEFVIDFGERYGETQAPLFHTRIVMTPFYMKAIVTALEEALASYQRRYPQGIESI